MQNYQYQPQYTNDDVEVESVTNLYQGFFKINRYQLRHALFAGGQSDTVCRELLERGDAVAVLPYDPWCNKLIFIEQFRVGALASKNSPWLLEVVAGMIDKQESKELVAIREAKEEAGLEIQKLIPMLNYLSSPGGTSERLYLYLGIVDSSAAGGIYGLEHEQEDIKVQVVDYNHGLELLENGTLDNAASVICMQWLALNKSKVDRELSQGK